jgi:DeoR/GlpR family transcriptional regulator of sugar metabolism
VLTAERRRAILGRLERDGKVVASELVAALGVSEDTVRRDLRELATQGLVQRVHGGALPAAPAATSFAERLEVDAERKAALARAALPLLDGAGVILLDGGTSAVELARRLPHDRACTVLTNAPPVATVLAAHPLAEVVLLGGRLLKSAQVTVGAEAVDALRRVRADVAVLGVCSLHPDVGVTARDHAEAEVDRAMVAAAAEVVAHLSDVTHLVTDADPESLGAYAAAGITVVRA